jgi:hypothetical protein
VHRRQSQLKRGKLPLEQLLRRKRWPVQHRRKKPLRELQPERKPHSDLGFYHHLIGICSPVDPP